MSGSAIELIFAIFLTPLEGDFMTGERKALPQISLETQISVDLLRSLVRNDPSLQALGIRISPTRAYSPQEVEKIVDAYRARQKAKIQRLEPVT